MEEKIVRQNLNILPNKSKTYLLPLICEELGLKYIDRLVNTYLYYEEDYTKCIYLLYKYNFDYDYENNVRTGMIAYDEYLKSLPNFIKSYEFTEYVLYKLKIPEIYEEEYNKFTKGQYSSLKNETKNTILSFIKTHFPTAKVRYTRIKDVLIKNPVLKQYWEDKLGIKLEDKQELSSVMDKIAETFNLKL